MSRHIADLSWRQPFTGFIAYSYTAFVSCVDGRAYRYYLVRIDTDFGFLTHQVAHHPLDGGNTCGTADEQDLIDLRCAEACVGERFLGQCSGLVDVMSD